MQEGKIVLPPQFANQHNGTASLEGLFRSTLQRTFSTETWLCWTGAAHITDVPLDSWSYASGAA